MTNAHFEANTIRAKLKQKSISNAERDVTTHWEKNKFCALDETIRNWFSVQVKKKSNDQNVKQTNGKIIASTLELMCSLFIA